MVSHRGFVGEMECNFRFNHFWETITRNVYTVINSCLQCFLKTNKESIVFLALPWSNTKFQNYIETILSQQYLNLLSVLLNVKTVFSSLRFKSVNFLFKI